MERELKKALREGITRTILGVWMVMIPMLMWIFLEHYAGNIGLNVLAGWIVGYLIVSGIGIIVLPMMLSTRH